MIQFVLDRKLTGQFFFFLLHLSTKIFSGFGDLIVINGQILTTNAYKRRQNKLTFDIRIYITITKDVLL